MLRVLQLIDREPEFEAARTAAALTSSSLGAEFHVEAITIGRGGDFRNVASAAAGLRRSSNSFELAHAFGNSALTAAALGTRLPIVYSPSPQLTRPSSIRWLRAISAYRRLEVISSTSTLRRVMVERGIPIERCHLIRPGVDFARVKRRRDPELRAELGFADTDRVILAAGESTRSAAHADAAWAAGILHVADPKYRLLLWGRGPLARQLAALGRRWRIPDSITLAEQRLRRSLDFEDLLPAADLVMVTARGPVATLPIAIAMAAGLPIVSTVTYTVSELLEDHHTALMAPPHKPRLLARRVLDLEEEPGVQWKIADMARTEAYEYFPMSRFLEQWRAVYQHSAQGQPVHVPERPPGAGLRFHGRV